MSGELHPEFHEVLAPVAVVRHRHVRPAERLRVPGEHGAVEDLHLVARVVHVVLARDVEPGSRERAGEPAAEHCAARVTDVHRPGGVYAHELDLHAPARAHVHVAERLACGADGLYLGTEPVIAQPEVHEPRRRGGDLTDRPAVFGLRKRVRERLRYLQRRALRGLGHAQRQAGGEVAVVRLLRALHEAGLRQVERGERAGALRLADGVAQACGDEVSDEHRTFMIPALRRNGGSDALSVPTGMRYARAQPESGG